MQHCAQPRLAFFGSSLVSAWWNGAATYYRGLLRALAAEGWAVTFLEPDAYTRQQHRDIPDPSWAEVVVWEPDQAGLEEALQRATKADVVVKASGVGVLDPELEAGVLAARRPDATVIYWDVDAPATLDRLHSTPHDPLRSLLPRYDLVLTYGGGPAVVADFLRLGARECVPIYNAVDPDLHHPAPPQERLQADLSFLGNRLPDREARVEAYFFDAARRLPERRFLLGGNGWLDAHLPGNVHPVGHVYTRDHNNFNSSARAVLNIHRESMARYGWSPATRVFEAAAAGACLITDAFEGVEAFLEPEREVLVARDGEEVAALVAGLDDEEARWIGAAARRRVLAEHTYAHRIGRLLELLGEGTTVGASR